MGISRQFLVFGIIGTINTVLHGFTVIALVESQLFNPVPANIFGFIVANTFSFFANCKYTFMHAPSWTLYNKFFSVSIVGLVLTIGLSGLAEWMDWHYLIGLMLVIIAGPILTFILHRSYTFGMKTASIK